MNIHIKARHLKLLNKKASSQGFILKTGCKYKLKLQEGAVKVQKIYQKMSRIQTLGILNVGENVEWLQKSVPKSL
jgi:hypothetical protein